MSGSISSGENPLERLARRLPSILEKAMERALQKGLDAARARMSPGGGGPQVRSGRLLRSLLARVTRNGDTIQGTLSADAPYAALHEYGGVIQARQSKYLKFQVQGRWVQAKRVEIPARPYLRPGRDAAAQALEKEIFEAITRELS